MKSISRTTVLLTVAALGMSWAQGRQGQPAWAGQGAQQPSIDMSKQKTVDGTVTAVNISYGAQYPAITIGQTPVKVAPVWFMLDKDFEIAVGDKLSVLAAPSALASDPYLHAIEITKASGAKLALRDASGFPLWLARGGSGQGPANNASGGGCIDPASIATVEGTVESVNAGLGIQQPALVIQTKDGQLVSVKIGPERLLLDNDFELNKGEAISAKIALAACSNEYIALAFTTAKGALVLRNDDGTPAW
jgi:hypothetical protein